MANEISIFDYFDYRLYLREYYQNKRQHASFFTYRYIGQRLNCDHGLIVKIFMGERHLTLKLIDLFSKILGHTTKEHDYFRLLVLFGRAKTRTEIKLYFEQLLKFKEIRLIRLAGDKYEFYQHWYYTVVRELVGLGVVDDDMQKLAHMTLPQIKPSEAKTAVGLLERLAMIHRDTSGKYSLTDQFITGGGDNRVLAIRDFQKETCRLAAEALDSIAAEERDISTVSLTLNESNLDAIKEILRQARSEILKIAKAEPNAQRVYQLNLHLFPLSTKVQ